MIHDEPIEFELYSQPDEYARASALVWKHRKRGYLVWAIFSAMAGIAVALAFSYFGEAPLRSWAPVVFGLFVATFSFLGYTVGGAAQWRVELRQGLRDIASLPELPRMRLLPEAAQIVHSEGEAELAWSSFSRVVRDAGFILLYLGPQAAWYIPEASLDSAEVSLVLNRVQAAGHQVR